jgi:hypothetical protein
LTAFSVTVAHYGVVPAHRESMLGIGYAPTMRMDSEAIIAQVVLGQDWQAWLAEVGADLPQAVLLHCEDGYYTVRYAHPLYERWTKKGIYFGTSKWSNECTLVPIGIRKVA